MICLMNWHQTVGITHISDIYTLYCAKLPRAPRHLFVINFIFCAKNILMDILQNLLFHFKILIFFNSLRPSDAYICLSKLTIIGSDNGLSPERRQANTRTNAGILLIGTLGTNFSEILIGIQTFSSKKMHLKMSSAKWRPFVSASMC